MERLSSLDICRGLAIICMVAADIPVVTDVGIISFIGRLFAVPLFLFIAGVSYELFVISRLERGKNVKILNIETFWKAIMLLGITQFIFFLGVVLFPSEFSMGFNSTIFLIIAVGYLLSVIIPSKWIYQIPVIIIPFFLLYYFNNSIPEVLLFLFSSNPFPLIPYISYFFAGRLIMIMYESIDDVQMKNRKPVIFSALFVGLMLIILQLFMIPVKVKTRTGIPGFLLWVGVIVFVLSFISAYSDKIKRFDYSLSPFERIGKIAFSVYYFFYGLEIIVFPYLNRVYIINFEPMVQIIIYFFSIILFLIISANVEKIWQKSGYKFGFEWALRSGSAYLTKCTLKVFTLKS